MIPIRHASMSLQTGPFGSLLHVEDYVTGGTPLVNPSHLRGGRLCPDDDIGVNTATRERLARFSLKEGDNVFARRGELGRSAVVTADEEGWICGTGSLRVRLKPDEMKAYYLQHLSSTPGFRDCLLLQSVGSTMDNLNEHILGSMKVPCPPLAEQQRICDVIQVRLSTINLVYSRIRDGIAWLQEYRTALISAAVTGQIDVRGEVDLGEPGA